MTASSGTDTGGDDSLIERLADEFAARFRRGERPAIQEYVDRYPHLAEELRDLLPAMAHLEGALHAVETPAETKPGRYPQFRDFVILREIGSGGMGVVYEAEQVSLGRRVALKVLTQKLLRDARQRLRFEREAKSAARLHHTNIVPVFGFGEHDGTPYYVMQCIEGAGLDAVIAEIGRLERGELPATEVQVRTATLRARSLVTGRFAPGSATGDGDRPPSTRETTRADEPIDAPSVHSTPGGSVSRPAGQGSGVVSAVTQPRPDQGSGSGETRRLTYWQGVARLGVQIGAALDYAHKNGVLHRDVKPSNLLLDAMGTVWVTDFGLAKADDQQNLTLTGDILGTLRYMPPEALEGKADARGDIYSLGLTLYELVALRPAFGKRDRNNLIKQVTGDEAPRLGRLRPGVPRDLETIVHKAIEKEPALRYPTAGELAADLQRFLDDEPIRARRSSLAERVARWTRRNKAWAAVIAGSAALLIVLSVISTLTASYFGVVAGQRDRLAKEEQRQREMASRARDDAEAARGLAERRGDEIRANLYRAEMNLSAQAAAAPGGVALVTDLVDNWRGARPDVRGWEWYYFNGLTHQARLVLGGSGHPLRSVAWSPDGLRLASGGNDGWIRVWDAAQGREVRAWFAHTAGVRSVAWSPGGDRIASGGTPFTIRVWDATDGRELFSQIAHLVPINCVAWSPDATRLASGGDGDGLMHIWTADPGVARGAREGLSRLLGPIGPALRTWQLPTKNAYCMAWSPDGHQVATAHHDGIVRIWDVNGPSTPRRELSGHHNDAYAVAWSPDGRQLASVGDDRIIRVWDAHSGEPLGKPLSGHSGALNGVAWSPDGRRLASASSDQTVRVWDPTIPSELHILEGHIGRAVAVTWSPDGRRLASAGEDGSVRVWDPNSASNGMAIRSPEPDINSLAWSPDGRRLASSSWGTAIRIWDPDSGEPVRSIDIGPSGSRALAWSPDGGRLAAGQGDGRIGVWSAADGEPRNEFRWKGGRTESLAWSPDGRRLAASSWDPIVRIWAADGSIEPVELPGPLHAIHALAWNHDGSRLASGESDRKVVIWDPARRQRVRSLAGHTSFVLAVAWSRDGRRLASAGEDNTIRIWDPESGASEAVLRGHTNHVRSVAWSPDGTRLASGGEDQTVRVWGTASWREILAFGGHKAAVYAVAWSPDGRRLASGGHDHLLFIRNATSGYSAERVEPALPAPSDRDAHRTRAKALSRRGDWDGAAAEFRQVFAKGSIGSAPAFSAGWWTAGPFESSEGEPDPDGDPIGPPWGPAEATDDGRVELGRHLPPDRAGAAYALHRVWSPVEGDVSLRVGASGPVKVWLNNRTVLESRPSAGAVAVEEVRVSLPAGWSTLAFRVEAGGDRPALRAWLEGDVDRARDRIEALLMRGRLSDAGPAIEAETTARPRAAGPLYSVAARAAHHRAAWLRDRGKPRDSAEAGRMAALWFDRLRAARPSDPEADVALAAFLADGLDPACRRAILEPNIHEIIRRDDAHPAR